jgi:hypothetical protein
MCSGLPKLPAELALLGEVFAASNTPETPAQTGDKYLEFAVVGQASCFVTVGQMREVVAMGYAGASSGIARVALLANLLPWCLHHQPMYIPSLSCQLSKVLCHHPHPLPHLPPLYPALLHSYRLILPFHICTAI